MFSIRPGLVGQSQIQILIKLIISYDITYKDVKMSKNGTSKILVLWYLRNIQLWQMKTFNSRVQYQPFDNFSYILTCDITSDLTLRFGFVSLQMLD